MNRLKLILAPVSVLVLATACDSDSSDETGADTDMTTGADATGDTADTANPTVPTPTTDTPTGNDTDTPTGNDTQDTSDEESGDETVGAEESSSGGEVPVEELPFGGSISWSVQDLVSFGSGRFYTVEPPVDPESKWEPDGVLVPLGEPRSEDEITIFALQDPPKPGPDPDPDQEPTFTNYDVGPQFFADGTDVALAFELDPEAGTFDPGFLDLVEPYAGGAWTLDIPGNDDVPGAVFEDVFEGVSGAAGEFEVVNGANGLPEQLVWNVLDAQETSLFTIALGEAGEQMPLCAGHMADDGELDIPAECVGSGEVDLPDAFNLLIIVTGHHFMTDVPFNDHRLRLQLDVNTQLTIPLIPGE